MSDYVPTTEDINWKYRVMRVRDGATDAVAKAEFDRWLSERDDEVAAKAWDEGREAQQAYAAQTASALIRYPEPVKPPSMPENPYRKEVQS